MSACEVGCIGCRKCVKECPKEAITVVDNVAHIDPEKCINLRQVQSHMSKEDHCIIKVMRKSKVLVALLKLENIYTFYCSACAALSL